MSQQYIEWSYNKLDLDLNDPDFNLNNRSNFWKSDLEDVNINDILDFFDELSKTILNNRTYFKDFELKSMFYIASWCKKKNLKSQIDISLNNSRALDNFTKLSNFEKKIRYIPRGVIGHWMSGNIPTLGIISMLLGIVTKNKNIIKLSNDSFDTTKKFLQLAEKINFNKKVKSAILNSILVLRFGRDHTKLNQIISKSSNVRIIWGNNDTIKKVKSYDAYIDVIDIVFKNKVSFALIDIDKILIARNRDQNFDKLISDISVFEQKACASPHNIFVKTKNEKNIESFMSILSTRFKKKIFNINLTPRDIHKISNARIMHSLNGKVISGEKFYYTIIYNNNLKFEKPIFFNTIFIKKINDIASIFNFINDSHQSIGVYLSAEDENRVQDLAVKKKLNRICKIGTMTNFELPWDGNFLINQIVQGIISPNLENFT